MKILPEASYKGRKSEQLSYFALLYRRSSIQVTEVQNWREDSVGPTADTMLTSAGTPQLPTGGFVPVLIQRLQATSD